MRRYDTAFAAQKMDSDRLKALAQRNPTNPLRP
jgi:hypothetical protein